MYLKFKNGCIKVTKIMPLFDLDSVPGIDILLYVVCIPYLAHQSSNSCPDKPNTILEVAKYCYQC